ncbi:RNA pol II accessory factor, Cdc73 family-domain-containing protein [Suillus subalutaceus]|uniref:RNA pol II accessory factor, Cdc73 family-domain-containing protein n=1 Tax=Suillus subalutaceus TaxID=48586 RepID=UPI001B85E531|nr:RNA pol II accessory factor, Cdc73 family-domain-containing protein [Suillus subalutaceus]KAG1853489.1 RNA pol II accessory factor, Cdc73 family-domain-containing protein [Suillus subalutaceus]
MSSTMDSDPLLALRHAIKTKSPITYVANSEPTASLLAASHIVLSPTLSLPKSTTTRYSKPGTSASLPSDFFTLEAVYLAWLLRDAPAAEYMKQARDSGLAVGFVSVTERKSIVEWLEGKVNDLKRIVSLAAAESTTPPGTPTHPGAATIPLITPKRAAHAVDTTTTPSKRRYVADQQDVEIVKRIKQNEVELRDRNTVLRGTKPNNFSALRAIYSEKLKKLKETKPGAIPAPAPAAGPHMQSRKAKNQYPIIMISSSPTALITMHNVKRFLQESLFESSSAARERAAAAGNSRAEDVIHIDRRRVPPSSSSQPTSTSRGDIQRYFVVDSTDALQKFGADAWERVVCVMTTGQAWQFRPYRWSEPRALFHHVKGVYVSWANDPPNTKIKDWNVTELKIDPHRRHIDKSVVAHFWQLIDDWTIANKPWLIKS